MRVLALVSVLVLVSACVSQERKVHSFENQVLLEVSEPLSSDVEVIIATPADGVYVNTPAKLSGSRTANAVRDAFVAKAANVSIDEGCDSIDCISEKFAGAPGYAVVPIILHWEERATEWSGVPDQVKVQIDTYDISSKTLLASFVIRGYGKQWTYGGEHPQDLLPVPLANYVATLY